jgi:hypothetical protein
MHTHANGAKMKRWAVISLAILSVMIVLPGFSSAEENMTFRVVQHILMTESVEAGDIPGHIIGITHQSGLAFHSNGEIGTTMVTASVDYVNGKGTLVNYRVNTFNDGSTINIRSVGTTTPVDGGKRSVIEGSAECIGGTGRFEGFKGTGIFKGERIGPLKTGSDSYYNYSLSCMKP